MEDMILHYGIDGQKWGVRHGPPYPLSRQKDKKWSVKTKNDDKKELNSKYGSLKQKSKAKIVLENADDLSVEELKELLARIELEEKLYKIATSDQKAGKEATMKVLGKLGGAFLGLGTAIATPILIDVIKKELAKK